MASVNSKASYLLDETMLVKSKLKVGREKKKVAFRNRCHGSSRRTRLMYFCLQNFKHEENRMVINACIFCRREKKNANIQHFYGFFFTGILIIP